MTPSKILVVDDDPTLRMVTERHLSKAGYECAGAEDAHQARSLLSSEGFEVALLDVSLPGESGLQLLSHIQEHHAGIAVVMVTGHDDPQLAQDAVAAGAYGYMVKPARPSEMLINIANALHRRTLEAENRRVMERLEATVLERTRGLTDALERLQAVQHLAQQSQVETILRLARMVEFRDQETGLHIERMSQICEILSRTLDVDDEECGLMRLASQLHDLGKVAIPDAILLKPGRLTPEEYENIKAHAEIGYEILADSESELVQLGSRIARSHHERWDGGGYPDGLVGTDIPREGRIAAVADVFDALTSDRVYRPAFPVEEAVEMIDDARGRHFDPEVVDAFHAARREIYALPA